MLLKSTPRWERKTRKEWQRIAAGLLDAPILEPEPGSVLAQLDAQREIFGLAAATSFLSQQAGRFMLAALSVPLKPQGPSMLSAVGPLSRSALLCASKLVSVFAPLCLEVRQLGPARQLTHDVMVEGYLENERRCLISPSDSVTLAWNERERSWQLEQINHLRHVLGVQPIGPAKIGTQHILVREGVWIWDAQRKSAGLRELHGAEYDDFAARMEWAWSRGSTITHGAPSFRASPSGMEYAYPDDSESNALIRYAVEMAVSATIAIDGVLSREAAPAAFKWTTEGVLPRKRPPWSAARQSDGP